MARDRFIDDVADEEDDDNLGEDDEDEDLPRPKKKQGRGSGDEEDEGQEDGEAEEGPADSSEEEEEEENEYDYTDKFIVREDEEEEEEGEGSEGSEGERRKKKHKRRRDEFQLEEEDYELLEENQGIRRPRPSERKRIRKRGEVTAASTGDGKTAADHLKDQLFGPDDEEGLADEEDEEARLGRAAALLDEDIDEEEDEFADFIDDDEGGVPGQRRRRRRTSIPGAPPGVSTAALREAHDIFGDVSELLEAYERSKRDKAGADQEDDELLPPEEDDDEAAETYQAELEERQRIKNLKKVRAAIEPQLMARHMLLPEDDRVRQTDIPERELLDPLLKGEPFDIDSCAQWVFEELWGMRARAHQEADLVRSGRLEVDGPPHDGRREYEPGELEGAFRSAVDLSHGRRGIRRRRGLREQTQWKSSEEAQGALRKSIREVLQLMFEKHYEVPWIASYRKEVCGELLSMTEGEGPTLVTDEEVRARRRETLADFPEGTVQSKHRGVRRWDVLWAVQGLARKWRALQRRREVRQRTYEAAMERAATEEERDAISTCLEALVDAFSAEEVDDVDAKFRLVQLASVTDDILALSMADLGPHRRPQRASHYTRCKQAGLGEVVAAMGITAAQLAENLDASYKRNEPENVRELPEDLAAQSILEAPFDTPEAVLKAVRHIAVSEIASEPKVRDVLRERYYEMATVSTEPTKAGETVLDPFHPLGRVKRIRNKPLKSFEDTDTYLRIHQAEKDGLITITMQVPDMRSMMAQIIDNYLSNAVSSVGRAWDDIRKAVLEEAVSERILPALESEMRVRLLADAREVAAREAADALWEHAKLPPLHVRMPDEDELVEKRRFMACCWGPGDPATVLVMVDESGALLDVLFAGQLSGGIPAPPRRSDSSYDLFRDPRKAKDAARICEFMLEHKPHAVLVGAANSRCKVLKEDLDRLRDHILEHMPQAFTRSETGDIDVRYADESLAALWELTAAARQEFPEQKSIVRRAVALARHALDPLAVLAALFSPANEILSLTLHPLQSAIPADDLLRTYERVMVTAVSQVGADLNAMASAPWMAAPLQFVPGLGPRKAAALLKAVQRNGRIYTRYQMWKDLGVMESCIFRNCAPFIRIRGVAGGMLDEDEERLDYLDDTRVDPQLYSITYKLAAAALRAADALPRRGRLDDHDWSQAIVQRALSRPNEIESLDLEALLTGELAEEDARNRSLSALIDISFELVSPYMDLRGQRQPLKEDEVFWLLSGESKETLKLGRRVEALVRWVGNEEARCQLPAFNNLDALLHRDDISSSMPVSEPRDRLRAGDTVAARIKDVTPAQWVAGGSAVSLTTASRDLADEERWESLYCAALEPNYHILSPEEMAAARRREHEEARVQRAKSLAFVSRPIRHPAFKNVSATQAVELLEERDVGDCVIRPSPKGTNLIALTIKVFEGIEGPVYLTQDVLESNKETGPGAHLKLSTPLIIENKAAKITDTFGDLDDVTSNFVDNLVSRVREVTGHRKFKDGTWEVVQAALREEKAQAGRSPVYCLGIKYEAPGMFYLAFILPTMNASSHREYFAITQRGFYFRQKMYTSVEKLLAEFKRAPVHKNQPPPPAPTWNGQQRPPPAPTGVPIPPHLMPSGPPSAPQPQYGAPTPHYGAPPAGPPPPYQQPYPYQGPPLAARGGGYGSYPPGPQGPGWGAPPAPYQGAYGRGPQGSGPPPPMYGAPSGPPPPGGYGTPGPYRGFRGDSPPPPPPPPPVRG
eukprot:jgi/Botrbrau1/1106/Bobra.0162s0007.1